jgi:hypothetical protein
MTPEQVMALAFQDELEKISARKIKLTLEQMQAHASRIDPRFSGPLKNLREGETLADAKRQYREVVRKGSGMFLPDEPLDIDDRLRFFKRWKRQGVAGGAHGSSAVASRSAEPVVLYSGGGLKGLRAAQSTPASTFDHPQYIPGQTSLFRRGLYATPSLRYAQKYSGRAIAGDTPAIARITVPRKYITMSQGNVQEALLPTPAMQRAQIEVLPRAEALQKWGPK